MDNIIDFFINNQITLLFVYFIIIVLVVLLIYKVKHHFFGTFNEAKFYRYLKRLYKEKDYPYIKEIILPINKETYLYYDAIVFGDKFIYLIEIKNHNGEVKIDPLDDWYYYKNKVHPFINPFYDLDLKLHVLNRYLEINKYRLIPVTVYSPQTKIVGYKGKNNLIMFSQIAAFIEHFESNPNTKKFTPDFIEEKGNYILDINIKKKSIRKQVINDIKNNHIKR